MSNQIAFICVLIILVIFSSFFSAAETAYTSIRPIKLQSILKKTKKRTKLIEKHYKSFGWTFATILISNNLVNVAASSLTTYLFSELLAASSLVTIISTVVVTPIIVIFGEIIPKILAKKYSYGYLLKTVYVLEFFNWLFFPITFPLSKVALQAKITNTEKEIKNLLQLAHQEGILEAGEATLAQNALDLDSKVVKQIMTPKTKIVSISPNATVLRAKKLFLSSGHSRLLIKEKSNYIGVLILKDMVFLKDDEKIQSKIIPLITVSQSILVTKALEKMRINKAHIALVIEKKGSSSVKGIVTLEDILEELVGEIYDEHDQVKPIRAVGLHKYIALGSASMVDLEQELNFKFEDSQSLSVKQWLQSRINRMIKKQLRYEYKDKVVFKVIKNNRKQETLIEISKKLK